MAGWPAVDLDLTEDGPTGPSARRPTLDPDREAAYAEWVERLHEKRASRQRAIRGDEPEPAGPSSYWSEDALYESSRRLEADPDAAVRTRAELLAVLGLGRDASDEEVQRRYRRLAKEHHPDRFFDADQATRDEHAEEMQRIVAAYRALQS